MHSCHSLRHLAAGLLVYVAVFCRAQENQDCSIERLRACGSDFVLFGNATSIPDTAQKLQEACNNYTTQIACTLKYVDDCLDGTTRGTSLVAIKAAEEDFEAICTEGNDLQKQFLESAPCANAAGAALNTCIRDLYVNLQRSLDKAPRRQTVHHACCFYGHVIDCLETALSGCEGSSPAKQFLLDRVDHIFGEALSLVCGTYTRGSANCAALPALPQLDQGAPEPISNMVEYCINIIGRSGSRDDETQ
uniref:Putative secreted protein n=1 Tax=Amblyomma triste TaxID=251400 RepID=A0A023GA86_AMBTT